MHRLPRLAVIVLSVALAACADDPSIPTTPTTGDITDVFTDTLQPNGAKTHPFTTARSGTVTATLTALDPNPNSTLLIGVALGTLNVTGTCQLLLAKDATPLNSSVTGAVTSATSLCLRVSDAAGVLTEPTTYTVQVVHP